MEKLKMLTLNLVKNNIEKINQIFPDCITEHIVGGVPELAIDFDKLKQDLSGSVVEGDEERYQFTWPGKKQAIITANAPINKTLRPCREESIDFNNTENLYIEGDNLDVLKLLREGYLGKVKVIYIDPPYNTGNDLVYKDDFATNTEEYIENSGQTDDDGNCLVANTESNGRFHSDWLNMIYPRLKIAKDLLSDDGVIFISVDDNEQKNLRNICDEIFGISNFLAQIVWERAYSPINLMKHFSPSHDYILVYAKNAESAICNGIPRDNEANNRYTNPDNDPRGVWKPSDLSVGPAVESNIYPITTPSGRVVEPPAGRSWRLSQKAFSERLQDNRIWFGPRGDGVPAMKRFLSELRKNGITPMTIWKHEEVGHSQGATQSLAKLFDGKKYFDYPKPVGLIERCVALYSDPDSIIMDFFSGSATTAQSVFELNAQDGGTRRFILVQLPEEIEEKSPACKDGYKTICDLAKERIRRAGKKVIEEQKLNQTESSVKDKAQELDVGFRVLKLDSSNMKDVYYKPSDVTNDLFVQTEDNIKEDRTDEDLLFQVMLEPLQGNFRQEGAGRR